jgi:uncharacterized membrane protein (UPF0182 family)
LGRPSRRFWIAGVIFVLIVLLASLRTLAVIWTDQMWFSQGGFGEVYNTLLATKVGLAVVFGLIFFALMWGNLMLTDRFGARDLSFEPEDEVVRRFQNAVRPYAGRVYAVIAVITGLIAGLNASGQWNTWLLFVHRQSFGTTDPLFHKDVGFYVFDLPFISFVVTWILVSLFVTLIVTSVFHFLNGGIRTTRRAPRVAPRVKAHLSVIGAGIALMKAFGYVIARWELVNANDGVVGGAGYTDVHARLPALTILVFLSLASALILLANVRSRGWSLPAVAVGLWAFVALIIGVLYPTFLQTFKVSPAQATLEAPYIARNITATRQAYGVTNVQYHSFAAATSVPPKVLKADADTLNNIRLWDPDPSIALATVTRRQSIRAYYTFSTLGVDRYVINGKLTPVLIGARELAESNLPAAGWVNTHLQYTHGIGAAVLAANQVDPTTGNPIFDVANVPPTSTAGMPKLTQPDIYFGIGDTGWVVANTKQAELDYQSNSGNNVETHYAAKGGVAVGGFFSRLALAARLGDFNFLISNQITSKSRVLFVRDVTQMVQKAAPFLTFDSQPYAVIANGSVNFVLDGYTTSSQYPYSQNANNLNVSQGGLPYSFNYVRNSVKVVVNAYTGKMTFYVMDPSDPIIRAYAAAFPRMFEPLSAMPSSIRTHLRYPSDLFSVQAAILGRYHITSATAFYDASDRWEVSPLAGAGPATQALAATVVTDVNGNQISSNLSPMAPIFQVGSLPQANHQQLLESVAFVPAGNSSTVQNLSGFMVATSDPSDYGQLNVYETPRGQSTTSPAQADSEMSQNAQVSSTLSLLDQHGSQVLLGNDLMVPLDQSVLYVRPFYVTSTTNPLPQLKYVIVAFNQKVGFSTTLAGAIASVLGGSIPTAPTTPTGGETKGQTASQYLTQASADYAAAEAALKAGNLGTYQSDVKAMDAQLALAQKALG